MFKKFILWLLGDKLDKLLTAQVEDFLENTDLVSDAVGDEAEKAVEKEADEYIGNYDLSDAVTDSCRDFLGSEDGCRAVEAAVRELIESDEDMAEMIREKVKDAIPGELEEHVEELVESKMKEVFSALLDSEKGKAVLNEALKKAMREAFGQEGRVL